MDLEKLTPQEIKEILAAKTKILAENWAEGIFFGEGDESA